MVFGPFYFFFSGQPTVVNWIFAASKRHRYVWVSVCLSYVLVCEFILHRFFEFCHHPPICSDSLIATAAAGSAEWCFKLRRCIDNRRLFALKAGSTDDLLVHALLTSLSAVPSGVCREKWKGPLDGERQPVQPEYTHAGLEWSICSQHVLHVYSSFWLFPNAWRMVMEAEAVFAQRCARDGNPPRHARRRSTSGPLSLAIGRRSLSVIWMTRWRSILS